MKISVITTVYKQLDNLYLILLGLDRQVFKDFELIIAEDDDAEETKVFVEEARLQFDFPIKHVCQKDEGFQRTKILNKAIQESSGEYLVFLDGDCIPHKLFLRSYVQYLTPTTICFGRRGYLKKNFSEKLKKTKSISLLTPFNILFHCDHLDNAFYWFWDHPQKNTDRQIVGCNWGCSRQALLEVNGFDEDYVGWGCEDKDTDWRLRALQKYKFLNIKHKAIIYHLYHPFNADKEKQRIANEFMNDKIKQGDIVCKNGIRKLD